MRTLRKFLIGFVILWGLLALLVRSATPFIADYREQLAAQLSAYLGTPVTIGEINARWYGLRPLLEFGEVVLGGADERLHADRLTLDLSAKGLLFGSVLDALRVTIDGMQLTLVREPGGQVRLEGVGPLFEGGELMLPRHLHLVDTQVVWIDHRTNTPPLSIDDVTVVLARRDMRLRLRAILETESGNAELSASLDGYLASTQWRGETYLRIEGLDVARVFAPYIAPDYGLQDLDMDLESWTTWQDATPTHAQGQVEIRDLELRPPQLADSSALLVARAASRFTIDRDALGWRAGFRDLEIANGDGAWPRSDLAIGVANLPEGGSRMSASADYLRVQDVVDMLQVRLPWPRLREALGYFQPRGELHDLRLQADLGPDVADWRVSANFQGLSSSPADRSPGIDNLSGRLHMQADHLRLELASRDAILDFPRLFRDPLELRELSGRIDLLLDDAGWRLRTDRLVADSPHIATRTRLDLQAQHGQSPFVDLQTDFRDADAAFAKRYYPAGVLRKTLVEWLDHAIVSGRVVSGTALLHGSLDQFPFETSRNGIFQTTFATEDLVLDYRAGWPQIEQLDAQVRFHGNQLQIEADSGTIYDSRITGIGAHIERLNPPSAIRIQGQLEGPLQDVLRTLQEDALRDRFGQFAAALRGTGDSRLALDFSVPLTKNGDHALDGKLSFADARLSLPAWDLTLDKIQGDLNFDLDGLAATGIRGRALRAPVTLDVLPAADGATRIRTRGTFAVPNIARQLPAIPLQMAEGKAAFVVDVDVPSSRTAANDPILLTVSSDLGGIRIDLPEPFGKSSEASRAMAVRLPLGSDSATGRLDYAGEVSAAFSGDGRRVDLMFGQTAEPQPDPGIRVGGRLRQLDVAAWRATLARLQAGDRQEPPPLTIDLEIGRLLADPLSIEQLHLRLARRAGIWWGAADSADLAGSFRFAQKLSESPLRIDLGRLHLRLPVADQDATESAPPDANSGPDPSDLPDVLLSISELHLNEAVLGRLDLAARREPEGLRITELSLRDGQVELSSSGLWSSAGGKITTSVQGEASTPGLGDLLVDLGYSRQLEEADSKLRFDLSWPGNPSQLHRTTLLGTLGLDIAVGRLVELDPGVTRVVGLLNLNALTRRLRLDFRDFYKKGYSFDSITGDFVFDAGEARTDNLSVLGPTGRIDLRGSADLIAGSLEQKVTVTPKLDATLPIAGALAGGPVAGVAVLMAQQVLTKQVDRITRFEYAVSGPWANPNIVPLDTGGTLSKIFRQMKRGARQLPPGESDGEVQASGASAEGVRGTIDPAADPRREVESEQPGTESGPVAQDESKLARPLRGLMGLLKQGEPHGADLPGEDD